MPQKLGMIGMGVMGQAFIRNLHNSQFIIQGFDVDATRMNDLRNEGGVPVESPAKAAQGVKFVIMLAIHQAQLLKIKTGTSMHLKRIIMEKIISLLF